jgi:hypothetical protein
MHPDDATPEKTPTKKTPEINISISTSHHFKYVLNGVSLEFTLSPENVSDFKKILTHALQNLEDRF